MLFASWYKATSPPVCPRCVKGLENEEQVAYCNSFPAEIEDTSVCAGMIIQAGIKRVVCDQPDFDHQRWGEAAKIADTLFREAGLAVNYRQVGEEPTE